MMPRILMIGASGFIGQALGVALAKRGYSLSLLSRGASKAKLSFPCEVFTWPGDEAPLPAAALNGVDAVINLAGESIADGRWTATKKRRFRTSRLGPTEALAAALRTRTQRPRVVVQASAIGYYGDTGEQTATEGSPAGSDFLAKLCVDWESAAHQIKDLGVRLATIRIGVVLGLNGGALPQLSKLYRLGIGAAPGDGQQWFSWIHLDDLVELFVRAVTDDELQGPINAVAPHPVRYEELHRAFTGRSRGAILKAPSPLMRVAVGESATMLLASLRVEPAVAQQCGFHFQYPHLSLALAQLLGTGPLRECDYLSVGQWVPAPLSVVTDFFGDAHNLEAITPPWLRFQVLDTSTPKVVAGTRIRYRLTLHGLPLRWISVISTWDLPARFVDEQVKGPFKVWHHTHEFTELGGGTLVTDLVRFQVPLGLLGGLTAGFFVEHDVSRIFAYRREQVAKRFG